MGYAMSFDFVANIATDGTVSHIDGETWNLLGMAPHDLINENFLDVVAEHDRFLLSDMLFNVKPGQKQAQAKVSFMSRDGVESPATLYLQPVFERGIFRHVRLAAALYDPLALDDGPSAQDFEEQTAVFQDTLYEMIDGGTAGQMSVFSANGGGIGTDKQAGDRLHALISAKPEAQGRVHRLSESSTALLHDGDVEELDIHAEIHDAMEPFGGVSEYSVDLSDDSIDATEKADLVAGVLAAASQPGVALPDGKHSLKGAYQEARTAVAEAIANKPPPEIHFSVQMKAREVQIGMADVPELMTVFTPNPENRNELIEDVLRAHLDAVAKAKPDNVPVCVPINAASLLQLERAEWDLFDLMVMPVGLKKLDPSAQKLIAQRLSSQYVMADVADLAHSPTFFADLVAAEALSFLRIEADILANADTEERDTFLSVVDICSDRGIYILLSDLDERLASFAEGKADQIFVPEEDLPAAA